MKGVCFTSVLPLLLPLRLRPSGLVHMKWSLAVNDFTELQHGSDSRMPAGLNKGVRRVPSHSADLLNQLINQPPFILPSFHPFCVFYDPFLLCLNFDKVCKLL